MKMSEYFTLFDFNYNSQSDSKIKHLVDLMKIRPIAHDVTSDLGSHENSYLEDNLAG